MALEIVWRNPLPLATTVHKVQRIISDEFHTVYAVTDPDTTHELELITGTAA